MPNRVQGLRVRDLETLRYKKGYSKKNAYQSILDIVTRGITDYKTGTDTYRIRYRYNE